jgi:hypothetical protein
MCCCDVQTLIEAYRIEPRAAGLLLSLMLMETTKDDKGHCHDEHGHWVPCPGRAAQSHVVRVGRRHNYAVWSNQPGHVFLTKNVLSSRRLDATEKAELVAASMLGHFHVGRTNTGKTKNAFDAANGRWPDGTLELVDAKTSHDARGLKFKKDSRENQFDSWRRGEDQEPGKTRAAQIVFHAGSGDVPAGVYLVPGIPMSGTVPLKNAGKTFDPANPERPIFVSSLASMDDLKEEATYSTVQKKVRQAMNSIDPKRLNKLMEKNYDKVMKQRQEAMLNSPRGREIALAAVAQHLGITVDELKALTKKKKPKKSQS